ncbi:MAG: ribosomal-processing cysteine protease Prp [Filifactoraceae bacterium]
MIKILITKNSKNQITEISGTGHADYEKYGKDIVCAAVSILFQSTLIGLTEVVKVEVEYEMSEAHMLIRPKFDNDKNQFINALLDTLEVSLEGILKEYPRYLNITRGGASNDKN